MAGEVVADLPPLRPSAYLDELPPMDVDTSFQKPFRPDRLAAELERLPAAE